MGAFRHPKPLGLGPFQPRPTPFLGRAGRPGPQSKDPLTKDPLNRSGSQFGTMAPYNRQGRAIRGANNLRLSEHEHITAYVNQMLATTDPSTGMSPLSRSAYRLMVTLTIPRDMAVIKTRYDMRLRDQIREALRSGVVSPELAEETRVQADIRRTIRARDEAIAARRAAG